jgi:hypothetical protein
MTDTSFERHFVYRGILDFQKGDQIFYFGLVIELCNQINLGKKSEHNVIFFEQFKLV